MSLRFTTGCKGISAMKHWRDELRALAAYPIPSMSTRSIPFAVRALYEYDVEQDDDLPFEPDQIITVTEVCDDQWYYGHYEANGAKIEGMFPRNYVEDAPIVAKTTPKTPERVNQTPAGAASPKLPPVPQPQVRASTIDDDWGSDNSDDDRELPHREQAVVEPSVKAPHKLDTTAETTADKPGTKSDATKAPTALDTATEQLSLDEKPCSAPAATESDRQLPDITPGESLSSNFKSRRGIFDQKEEEQDFSKPLTRNRTNPQKLQRWQPQQEGSAPSPNSFSQKTDEEEAAPRVSIKERLAMIQQQEQEMEQREDTEKKRREQEDEQLRQEESRRIREEEEKAKAAEQANPVEDEAEEDEEDGAPVGPIKGRSKPPSIPVLPRVSDTQAQESRAAGSFDDDEEGARKIALRERMARISGLSNSGGISLGMMLGRNPDAPQAASGTPRTRRPKKKDVSAMSDLERELYLASVEYDEMHGAEDEDLGDEKVQEETGAEQPAEEQDIADDETLIGARDTDAETLAESDNEPEINRHLPVAAENPSSVPVQAPVQASPARVSSLSQKTPAQAPGAPAVPNFASPRESHAGNAEVGPGSTAAPVPDIVVLTPPTSSRAPVSRSAPSEHGISSAPPVPKDASLSLDNFEDPAGTDTTALAADEGSSSGGSDSDDEYSDAANSSHLPTLSASTHTAPSSNRTETLRQHDLQARMQSDSETGYEADADTDDPLRQSEADASGANVPALETRSLPPPPVPHASAVKRAPPQVPNQSPTQAPTQAHTQSSPHGQPPNARAPPSIPAHQPLNPPGVPSQLRSPPPIPGQAPPVPKTVHKAAPPPPQPSAPPVPTRMQAPRAPPQPAPSAPAPVPAPVPTPTLRVPPQPPSQVSSSPPKSPPQNRVARTPSIGSLDENKSLRRQPSNSGGSEVDLDLSSLWFTEENGLPASIDPTKVAVEFENQETNKRGRVIVTHDVYVLYSDLSQLHIEIKYDKAEPAQAHGTQKYIPPPKVDSSELSNSAKTIGARIADAASRHTEFAHTSAFVKSLFKEVPEALPPIKGSFGLSIYENFGGASVHQIDCICSGDVVVLVQANFQGSKSALTSPLSPLQKQHKTIANSVYVVKEWDGSKKKVHVFDTKKESFRLGDLTSGMVRIYRPVSRDIVGW